MRQIVISKHDVNRRLDKFVLKYLNGAPKGFVYKMLRKKNIVLNGSRAQGHELLKENDSITLYLSDETLDRFMEERALSLSAKHPEIIYEDSDVLLVNKPAGVLSHPQTSSDADTMTDRILLYLYEKNEYDAGKASTFTPALCNRLDRNTSGIVICGKNSPALRALNAAFADRYVDKYYLAVVSGRLDNGGVLKGYHAKDHAANTSRISPTPDGGDEVITEYQPLRYQNGFTWLQIKLITGKSHQIRAHLQSIGHPVAGDPKYGDQALNRTLQKRFGIGHQLLHAQSVCFHDMTGCLSYLSGMAFTVPAPEYFELML